MTPKSRYLDGRPRANCRCGRSKTVPDDLIIALARLAANYGGAEEEIGGRRLLKIVAYDHRALSAKLFRDPIARRHTQALEQVIRNPGLTAAIPFARTSVQLRRYWRPFSDQRGVSNVCLRSKTWMKVRFNDR
jgi:hypothetical protein